MQRMFTTLVFTMLIMVSTPVSAQFSWTRAIRAGVKATQAMTLSDEQMAKYVRQSVVYMDKNNRVSPSGSKYSQRLRRLTKGLTKIDGIPLNFKVYEVKDVNAFACPDGSVRVFSALMDIMNDDELLGVIGHELGHVALRHSKKALKAELLGGAIADAAGAFSSTIARLSDSQLGQISGLLMNAKYSRKQESEADDYGYTFLKKHGRNPLYLASAFRKLEKASGSGSQSKLALMFSSHPDTKKRIEAIESRAKKDGISQPSVTKTKSSTKSVTRKSSTKRRKSASRQSSGRKRVR